MTVENEGGTFQSLFILWLNFIVFVCISVFELQFDFISLISTDSLLSKLRVILLEGQ